MKGPRVQSFFHENTSTFSYVVFNKESTRCAIIDSVLDYDMYSGRTNTSFADKIMGFVKEQGLEVQWILETHVHADHLTAAHYIKQITGGKTAISHRILEVIRVWEEIFRNRDDTPGDGSQFDRLLVDEESFDIGSMPARIIYTPGHTPADATFIIGDAVFVGDAMLQPDVGTGRCDFLGGSAEDSFDSCQKIFSLPGNFRVFVGHDYPPRGVRQPRCMSTIEEQESTNVRLMNGIKKEDYVMRRKQDDLDKEVPKLLLPSLQVNLRAGDLGKEIDGRQYIKIPINAI